MFKKLILLFVLFSLLIIIPYSFAEDINGENIYTTNQLDKNNLYEISSNNEEKITTIEEPILNDSSNNKELSKENLDSNTIEDIYSFSENDLFKINEKDSDILADYSTKEKLRYDSSYSPENVYHLEYGCNEVFWNTENVKIKDIQLKDVNKKNLNGYVDIYVDGKYLKRLNFNHDKETLNLGKLKIGKHTIRIQVTESFYDDWKISVIKDPNSKQSTSKTTVKAPKRTAYYKANKYFKVTVKKSGKAVKGLKLKMKVYTGSKYKTYTIKTNKNGVAKLSTKKFKVGSHKVKITSTNKKYKVKKTSKIVIRMSSGSVSASKTVKIGKYKCKLSNKDIKKIKHGKQVTKNTGKYIEYKDYSTKKIKKAKVKISIRKGANDGGTKKGKYYAESWSSNGPIACKWIKL